MRPGDQIEWYDEGNGSVDLIVREVQPGWVVAIADGLAGYENGEHVRIAVDRGMMLRATTVLDREHREASTGNPYLALADESAEVTDRIDTLLKSEEKAEARAAVAKAAADLRRAMLALID